MIHVEDPVTAEYNGEIGIAFAPLLKRVVVLKANSEYGHSYHKCVFILFTGKILAKMTTNVEAEEIPESKATTPVRQQIMWPTAVVLTVLHLIALYAAAVVIPRVRLITFIWCRWRLVCLLHTYTSI